MRTESELVSLITKYSKSYYEGNPEISDHEFDSLVNELKNINPNNAILDKTGWGYTVGNSDQELKPHRYEVAKFENKVHYVNDLNISGKCYFTPKLDGGSILAYYTKGILDYVITRGDGSQGYDITNKTSNIIPKKLIDSSFTGMVRGELTMKNEIFNKYYSDRASNRNTAIGIIKKKNPNKSELNHLSFVAYTVRGKSDLDISKKSKVLSWILLNKFERVDVLKNPDNINDESLRLLIKSYEKYPIDGLVLTTENYLRLKDNTYVPEREVAYKTKADSALTKVKAINWNLTKSNKLIPVVIIDPVNLSGATISRVTGFNAKFIKEYKLGVGSTIEVERSGEVIPNIVKVVKPSEVEIPRECPICHHQLYYDGTHLSCKNINCKNLKVAQLYNWIFAVAKVKGISNKLLDAFFNYYNIDSVEKLYKLLPDIDLNSMRVEGVGDGKKKLLSKMIKLLNSPTPFASILVGLNLEGLSCTKAKKLDSISFYNDLMKVQDVSELDNYNLDKRVRQSIYENLESIKVILKLPKSIEFANNYKNYKKVENGVVESDEYKGLRTKIKVAITGALNSGTRNQFLSTYSNYIEEVSISKADYLITNNPNSNSRKVQKAKELGVYIVSESDFIDNFIKD